MSFSRHAIAAVLVAAVAAVAGIAVWTNARVDLGLRLETVDGVVRVADVTPDGIAARAGVFPGLAVTFIETVDRSQVTGGPVRHEIRDGAQDGSETVTKTVQLPGEAIEEARIAAIEVGYEDGADVYPSIQLARDTGVQALFDASWLLILGVSLGGIAWFALSRGAAGNVGRAEAVVVGAALVTPFAIMPAVVAGTAQGIGGGYLAAGAAALVVGSALAGHHPDRAWQGAGRVAGAVLLALTALMVARYLAAPALPSVDMRGQIVALIAATALVPALFAAGAASRARDRASLVSLGLVPGAAALVVAIGGVDPFPLAALAVLLGWQILPLHRLGAGLGAMRTPPAVVATPAPQPAQDARITERRDIAALLVAAVALVLAATQESGWAVIIGLAFGGLAAYALRRGFLGAGWTDAAAPIGAAVAIPILMLGPGLGYGDGRTTDILATMAAVVVAHLVAWRHPDPSWRGRLFLGSVIVAVAALVQERAGSGALLLTGLIPLVPAIGTLLTTERPTDLAAIGRLELLVVAATPGIALIAMVNGPAILILLGWFAAIVVWRRFTLTPLLGVARRSQQQLDLAVAAAEQERARLAADLHDDALQELTGLVRRLDAAGDTDSAELARGVAERLRGITSDLRLPLLDDFGAGPALEWLVARVRPMANGEVRLERSDPSRPPSAVELAVFRVAQEALANAVKHGSAPIIVRYHVDEAGRVSLSVDDAGPGIDPTAAATALASGHLGMANMQQRAEQIGALLNVRAWPTGGTHVGLEWRPQ